MMGEASALMGRIMIVDGKPMTGGGQRMLPLIAHALMDHDPVVVRPDGGDDQAALHDVMVEKLTFPSYPEELRCWGPMLRMLPQVLATAWRLRLCIRRYRIRTVIANDLYSVIPLLPATAGLGIPLIFYAHSCDLPPAAARLLVRCTGVIACSQSAADALPGSPLPVRVVHNAADVPSALGDGASVRGDGAWVIGYAGRIDANKNLAALIEAFACVLPAIDRPDELAVLEILGSGAVQQVQDLRTQIDQLGLRARIRWLPWTDHPLPVIAGWDAVVLVSHLESFGLCLIEGQMLGKPVMGTRRGGIPEIIDDGVSGILAASPAVEDLAVALVRLRAAVPAMAREGRRRAYHRFSPTAYGLQLRQALSELVESSRSAAELP